MTACPQVRQPRMIIFLGAPKNNLSSLRISPKNVICESDAVLKSVESGEKRRSLVHSSPRNGDVAPLTAAAHDYIFGGTKKIISVPNGYLPMALSPVSLMADLRPVRKGDRLSTVSPSAQDYFFGGTKKIISVPNGYLRRATSPVSLSAESCDEDRLSADSPAAQ
jgi:hypothetical protein